MDIDSDEYDIVSQEDLDIVDPSAVSELVPIEKVKQWLHPTDFLSPGNEYMKHMHSYMKGTGEWVRETPEFCRWLDHTTNSSASATNDSGCLWVKGVPGSGKSVFAASVAKSLHDSGSVVLFFFFRQIVATNHDPAYLLRDWLTQLVPHSRWLHQRLSKLVNSSSVDIISFTDLWSVLREAILKIDGRIVYCVADALDEMDDGHMEFIKDLKELGTTKPVNVKVLLTSRPIPRIEEILRDHQVESIRLDPAKIYPDIIQYVEKRLSTLETRLSEEKHNDVKDAICDRAKGLFLHARLMTDNLTAGLREGKIVEETLPTSLERLPGNLKELYTEMLAEHSRRSGVSQEQQFTILQFITHSYRPLRLIELGSIISLLQKDEAIDLKDGKELVRQSCGRLLEILEDETVSVIHHSFTEFLRDASRTKEDRAFPVLSKDKAHAMLALVALQYLDACVIPEVAFPGNLKYEQDDQNDDDGDRQSNKGDQQEPGDQTETNDRPDDQTETNDRPDTNHQLDTDNQSDTDDQSETSESSEPSIEDNTDDFDSRSGCWREDARKSDLLRNLRIQYPLLEYAVKNLKHHIESAESESPAVFAALDQFFQPNRNAFTIWLLEEWDKYRTAKLTPLHVAACQGWNEYVLHQRSSEISIDDQDAEGMTPLSYAADAGHVDIVRFLLHKGALPDTVNRDGLQPMHLAARKGRIDVVELLLAHGASPTVRRAHISPENARGQFGSDEAVTPLYFAASGGHRDIVQMFLPLVDTEWKCKAFGWSYKSEIVEDILKTGDVPVDVLLGKRTRLYEFASRSDVEKVKMLLKYGADPNARSNLSSDRINWFVSHDAAIDSEISADGPTPLHGLCGFTEQHISYEHRGRIIECLELLIKAGGKVDAKAKDGWTPLHLACRPEQDTYDFYSFKKEREKYMEPIVAALLSYGADANARLDDGRTALHLAYLPEVIKMLVQHGANISLRTLQGSTPLHNVILQGSKCSLKTLDAMLEMGADPNARDGKGNSSLHLAMEQISNIKDVGVFEKLISAGVDLNLRNKSGLTPILVYGAHYGSGNWTKITDSIEKIMRLLLATGMDLESRNGKGQTLLFRLTSQYRITKQYLKSMILFGCDPLATDYSGATLLHYHVQQGNSTSFFEFLDFFVDQGLNPKAVDINGNNLIHDLTLSSDRHLFYEKLKRISDLGVSTDAKNRAGQTPLHLIGLWNGGEFVLDMFLGGEYLPKSDVNAVDNKGGRPIHYAALTSATQVEMLLRYGADPCVLTYEGLSPLHIAARARQSNIVGLLIEKYREVGRLDEFVNLSHLGDEQRTPLHIACRSGSPRSVRYLLEAGADACRLDRRGRSPLYALAEYTKEEVLWVATRGMAPRGSLHLKDMGGISIDARPAVGPRGGTERTIDIVDMLVKAGADIHYIPNSQSWWYKHSALDVAVENQCRELVEELCRRGAKARDSFSESLLRFPYGDKEADLLDQIDLIDTGRKMSGSGGREDNIDDDRALPFMNNRKKIDTLLKLGDYNLLRKFAGKRRELKLEALFILAGWGHAILLEEFSKGFELTRKEKAEIFASAVHAHNHNLDVIRLLVEKRNFDVDQLIEGRPYKGTPLHVFANAQHFWHIEALHYVVKHGANVEKVVPNRCSPLMEAAKSSSVWSDRTLLILLENGADPNAPDDKGEFALNQAQSTIKHRHLLNHGAKVMMGDPLPLFSAVQQANVDSVELFLKAGADPNTLPESSESDPSISHVKTEYPLHLATKPIPQYHSVLPEVLKARKDKMIQLLLEHNADPFAAYADGSTVMQKAIEEKGLVERLMPFYMPDTEGKKDGGRTPLIATCFTLPPPTNSWAPAPPAKADTKLAMTLISRGANVAAVDDTGRTALHWLCLIPSDFDDAHHDLLTTLTTHAPALIHATDNNLSTPLHLSIQAQNFRATRTLLSLGSSPSAPDSSQNTPLHILAPHLHGQTASSIAAVDFLEDMLAFSPDPNAKNKDGNTALMHFLSLPVPSSANTTRSTYTSSSPAANKPPTTPIPPPTPLSTTQTLVHAATDIHATNAESQTALHIIAGRQYPGREWDHREEKDMFRDAFRWLLDRGVDARAEDGACRTAVDVAVAGGRGEIVALFGNEGEGNDDGGESEIESESEDE